MIRHIVLTTDLHFIPHSFALWDNLATAFGKANLWRFLLNGVVVTVSIFALQVLVAVPAPTRSPSCGFPDALRCWRWC